MNGIRECGILLPIASLPSKYGIGSFSKEAYKFVDQLEEAGQNYWQILPLGPTGYGDSPYQSFSAFAGNPYFIDLEQLIEAELLTADECEAENYGSDERYIKYELVCNSRAVLLRKAYERFKVRMQTQGNILAEVLEAELCDETKEYCFYAALKRYFDQKCWAEWDEDVKLRKPEALAHYQEILEDDIRFFQFQQMVFLKQWNKLKGYANRKGIQIIGDIPIYVAFDSADSWSHPELFQFDEESRPISVAGCPPDAFSETGQLWGNPLYRWDYHEETGFAWWMRRMEFCFKLYDVVRVDHFRGFDEYYAIPAGEDTAMNGCWMKGPGLALFQKMKETFGTLNIIAEDLGYLTPSVLQLLKDTGFPGMKVLQFAFGAGDKSCYLPYFYPNNCVVYTGTHDNDTIKGWYQDLSPEDKQFTIDYLNNGNSTEEDIPWDFIRLAVASVADLAVIPIQDYLGCGKEARINMPSTLGTNWTWRMKSGEFTPDIIKKCRKMNQTYGRGR